ncbi:thioester reductase, partial [Anaeromyces robustus]
WNENWEKNKNIIAIHGDLSQEKFGISEDKWDELCKEIQLIIHNGAMVHWMYPYEKMKNVNVLSTVQCLKMATTYHLKPFYFVSSISVVSNEYYLKNGPVMENDDLEGARTSLDSGYGQSKWVSEKLIFKAIERGVPACIIRPGFILGNSKNGVLNTDDFVTRMIIDCIQLKQYPNIQNPINACPVDYVAGTIIQIVSQEKWLQKRVFHICHRPTVYYNDIFEELHLHGYEIKKVNYIEWKNSLINLVQTSNNKNALFSLLPFVINDLPNNTKAPILNDDNTRSVIANTDVPIINVKNVVGKYLAYLIKIGLLKSPP